MLLVLVLFLVGLFSVVHSGALLPVCGLICLVLATVCAFSIPYF